MRRCLSTTLNNCHLRTKGEFPTALLREQQRKCTTVVKNEGSTARDHLANERTFLAWARSGLGFVGAGIGVFATYSFGYVDASVGSSQSLSTAVHPREIMPACGLLVGNGATLLMYSGSRYFKNLKALQAGNFIISKGGLFGILISTGLSTLCALSLIVYKEWACFHEYSGSHDVAVERQQHGSSAIAHAVAVKIEKKLSK